jgi:hypothetical protein
LQRRAHEWHRLGNNTTPVCLGTAVAAAVAVVVVVAVVVAVVVVVVLVGVRQH